MSQSTQTPGTTVPPEEIARRIAEYRRISFEHRAPPIMVYPTAQQLCPWPDCQARISGIRFCLDQLGDAASVERWLTEWWQGAGLVGRCPGCGRHVLFGYEIKKAVADPAGYASALLPEDWAEKADLVPAPAKPS